MNNAKKQINIPEPLVGLLPVSIVLVTMVNTQGEPNIITVGWVGVACSKPPMISIAIRPSRYSYELIKISGEFVLNIPTVDILKEVDYCGVFSGRNVDKFKKTRLKPVPALKVKAPLIKECRVNLECKVKESILLGSHELFIGEVIETHVDSKIIKVNNIQPGILDFTKIDTIVANLLEYWCLGKKIGNVFRTHNKFKLREKIETNGNSI